MGLFKRSPNYRVIAILLVVLALAGFFAYRHLQKYEEGQEALRLPYEELVPMDEANLSKHCGLFKLKRFCPEYCLWDPNSEGQFCGIDLGALEAARESYEDYLAHLVKKGSISMQEVAENETPEMAERVIRSNPESLKEVKEESVLLQAVQENPGNIQNIGNPTEAVQLMAIKENGCLIQYIKNPSQAVMDQALKTCPTALKILKDLTDEQVRLAIQSHPEGFEYLENPSDELMELAVGSGYFSEELAEMDEENMKIFLETLRKMAPSLTDDELTTAAWGNYSPNLLPTSKEVYVEAKIRLATRRNIAILEKSATLYPDLLEEKAFIMQAIDEPEKALKELGEPYDEDKLIELIFINPYIIKRIEKPTEAMQILAVYLDRNVYQYLKNPPENLKMFSFEEMYCDREFSESANSPEDSTWVDGYVDFSVNMPKEEALKIIRESGMRPLDEGMVSEYFRQFYVSVQKNKGKYLECKLRDITSQYQWLHVMS